MNGVLRNELRSAHDASVVVEAMAIAVVRPDAAEALAIMHGQLFRLLLAPAETHDSEMVASALRKLLQS
jgi:hypothetical protein